MNHKHLLNDFYSIDEVAKMLDLGENNLKRLASEEKISLFLYFCDDIVTKTDYIKCSDMKKVPDSSHKQESSFRISNVNNYMYFNKRSPFTSKKELPIDDYFCGPPLKITDRDIAAKSFSCHISGKWYLPQYEVLDMIYGTNIYISSVSDHSGICSINLEENSTNDLINIINSNIEHNSIVTGYSFSKKGIKIDDTKIYICKYDVMRIIDAINKGFPLSNTGYKDAKKHLEALQYIMTSKGEKMSKVQLTICLALLIKELTELKGGTFSWGNGYSSARIVSYIYNLALENKLDLRESNLAVVITEGLNNIQPLTKKSD